ncbi:class I SAM-dependent methyltransferase [Pseudoxanthomonas sp. CAU 1598]|uniref:Class I SAM-dependent methyltransferase n=1 Tax=Pseudomarimonas arenosa TaxID=2774145 RepID=A0AAW3ZEU5_9GAMM|nr:class I SAM-dependent methyltransferase [Pseudomarimonas arenosa]
MLDIGCADRWLQRVLPDDCRYIGLDYLATGKFMYASRPDVFADAACLPLADGAVDVVTIFDVVEHLYAPQRALTEIARVLRPQGKLILSMPFLYPVHDAPHDYQRYTLYGIERELAAAGLRPSSLRPSLGSAESAGLVANLAIAGMGLEAIKRRSLGVVFLPLIGIAVPAINLAAWVAARLLPSWSALTAGYLVVAYKP